MKEEVAMPEAIRTEVPVLGSPVVLVAEDDMSNVQFIEAVLRKTDVTLLVANNGKEAVDLCREHPEISLVLMDLKMPVMDGLEATREIKSFRKSLPIIALTAFALSGDEKKAREAGCDDYTSKPVSREELLEKLKQYGIPL
jgi:CheY-like chemotaxis protein